MLAFVASQRKFRNLWPMAQEKFGIVTTTHFKTAIILISELITLGKNERKKRAGMGDSAHVSPDVLPTEPKISHFPSL